MYYSDYGMDFCISRKDSYNVDQQLLRVICPIETSGLSLQINTNFEHCLLPNKQPTF